MSLAFADVIIGFVLLFSTIPNMMRTMRSTESEVLRMMEETTNSPQAIVAGSMLTLSAQVRFGRYAGKIQAQTHPK